ncbi:ATP-grasp domain-containing protein [bacterium]|nr:ATP-grasp domain-containing protein [bacterium]
MSNVVLLFGGNSEERLVSVASAQNLAAQYNFDELVYQDFHENLYKISLDELFAHQDVFTKEFKPQSKAFAANLEEAIEKFQDKVIFLGLHGSQGENGAIQSLFEDHGIAFTGSGSEASHLAFEKNKAKEIIAGTDIKMPEEIKFKNKQVDSVKSKLEAFLAQHKKMVLKPTASGSSFGLYIVNTKDELEKALLKIKTSQFENYLAENFIKGRELTVGVIQEGSELISLPASEVIINEGRAFDYEGKYLGAGSKEVTPAKLSEYELKQAQELALEAHSAFGCYGYSRTDMILTEDGPYFLETNTLPGLSKPSFMPQQLLAADISFKKFIQSQIELAEARYDFEEDEDFDETDEI